MRRWQAALARPFAPALLIALGLALAAPSLGTGLAVDDRAQRGFLLQHLAGEPSPAFWWEMFGIPQRGPVSDVPLRIQLGLLPWWASPNFSMAFLRPLGAASHYLDYALYPDSPWLMHAHNLAWYALLLALVWRFYRALIGPGSAAALALLLYAVDEAHVEGAAWIAGRNTVMTACFVLATLLFHRLVHHRSLSHGRVRKRYRMLAPLCFGAGLFTSEGGLAALAYLVPYAVLLDERPLRTRLASLLPYAVIASLWRLVYRGLGYGVSGSGVYVDPSTPGPFLKLLPERLMAVMRDQFAVPAVWLADLPMLAQALISAAALVFLLAALGAFLGAIRARPRLQFWLAGTLLSALPICAIGSAPRLLFLTALGAFGLIAECCDGALCAADGNEATPRRQLQQGIAVALLCLHGPVALALVPKAVMHHVYYDQVIRRSTATLPWGRNMAGKTLLVLNTPNYLVTTFAAAYKPGPGPAALHMLGASASRVRLTRIDDASFELAPDGGYMTEPWSTMVRPAGTPFVLGYTVDVGPVQVEVVALTDDRRPARIRVTLGDMAAERYVWVYWNGAADRYEITQLPAVGGSLDLPKDTV